WWTGGLAGRRASRPWGFDRCRRRSDATSRDYSPHSSSTRQLRPLREWKGCWNPVARRECGELVALANEIRVGGDEQSVDPIAHKGVECRFDFVLGASVEDLHLQSKSTRRLGRVV